MLYFLKAKGPRTSKMIFWTVNYTNTNSQIHKYKFRKTQMHKYSIWQNDRNTQLMLYFWTAGGSRMSKMIIPSILIQDTQLTFARSHQVFFFHARNIFPFLLSRLLFRQRAFRCRVAGNVCQLRSLGWWVDITILFKRHFPVWSLPFIIILIQKSFLVRSLRIVNSDSYLPDKNTFSTIQTLTTWVSQFLSRFHWIKVSAAYGTGP